MIFYILIVCRVRKQIKKSQGLANNRYGIRTRPRSQSGPTFSPNGPFFIGNHMSSGAAQKEVEKRRCVSTNVAPSISALKSFEDKEREESKRREELEMAERKRVEEQKV